MPPQQCAQSSVQASNCQLTCLFSPQEGCWRAVSGSSCPPPALPTPLRESRPQLPPAKRASLNLPLSPIGQKLVQLRNCATGIDYSWPSLRLLLAKPMMPAPNKGIVALLADYLAGKFTTICICEIVMPWGSLQTYDICSMLLFTALRRGLRTTLYEHVWKKRAMLCIHRHVMQGTVVQELIDLACSLNAESSR
jgi:hypothetical protein